MNNDNLTDLWKAQATESLALNPNNIITVAKKQRTKQYIGISIMLSTVLILIFFTFRYAIHQWNTFNLGLILMISSLIIRILLEFYSLYRKEKKLVSMTQDSYHTYLKKHYKIRQIINYIITPICVAVYIFGFSLLLPYFKKGLSNGFYIYILFSGIISLSIVIAIIVKNTIKEQRFLKQLRRR